MFHFSSISEHGGRGTQLLKSSTALLAPFALLLALQTAASAQGYDAPFPIKAQNVSYTGTNPAGGTTTTSLSNNGNSFAMDLAMPHGFAQFPQPRTAHRAANNPKMRLRLALKAVQPASATDPAAETMYSIDEHGIHVRSVQSPNGSASSEQSTAANPAGQIRQLTAVSPFFGFKGKLPSRNDMRFLTTGMSD